MLKYRYEFGPFQLDPEDRLLLAQEQVVPLSPRIFDTLLALVERGGRVVSKDELLSCVWPDSIVEESNLTQNIYVLRQTLDRWLNGQACIETIPRRGYRLALRVRRVQGGEEGYPIRSMAVFPFRTLGGEPVDEYLRLGLANALITRLGSVRQIIVRPTSSVLRYASPDHDLLAAGEDLGVDAILDSAIEKSGENVRVTVQLIEIRGRRPLWASHFDARFTNLFALEDDISDQVVRALALELTGEERRQLTRRYTDNTEAYQAYLRGRFFCDKRTDEGLKKAIACFEEAVRIDPEFALAESGLADCYTLLGLYCSLPPGEVYPQAEAAAIRALQIDEMLAEAHCSLALLKVHYEWDWAGAEREFKRALELNPGYANAHHWYADYLCAVGRFEEAVDSMRRALAADPLSLIINANLALPYYYARQYDRAAELLRRTLEMDPGFALGHWYLGRTYQQQRKYDEAEAELQAAVSLSERHPFMLAALGRVYAASGQRARARRIIAELTEIAHQRYVPCYDLATIYSVMGEPGQALVWLRKSLEERSGGMFALRVDPHWDGLRNVTGFAGILSRLKFPD